MASQLTSVENKKMGYQIVKYLKTVRDSRPIAAREEIDALIASLQGVFEVDISSVDDFKAYNYYQYTLPELFSAGID
jgi:hypothetical protein